MHDSIMATNGQQIFFHAPRGTGDVSVTGNNQDNIRVTWNGQADGNGNALTKDWWFKGEVEVTYVFNGQSESKMVSVPGQGDDVFNAYA
jgi:hypothetical protein